MSNFIRTWFPIYETYAFHRSPHRIGEAISWFHMCCPTTVDRCAFLTLPNDYVWIIDEGGPWNKLWIHKCGVTDSLFYPHPSHVTSCIESHLRCRAFSGRRRVGFHIDSWFPFQQPQSSTCSVICSSLPCWDQREREGSEMLGLEFSVIFFNSLVCF